MATKKQQSLITTSSLQYYIVRSIQRICLALTALATSGLYAAYVFVSLIMPFASETPAIVPSQNFTTHFADYASEISLIAIILATMSIALSVMLLIYPRVQKHQKQLVADGVVIALTLLTITVSVEYVIKFVITQVG